MRNLSGEKGTILVIDDEASIRRILQTRLEMIGYSVVVTNGSNWVNFMEETSELVA